MVSVPYFFEAEAPAGDGLKAGLLALPKAPSPRPPPSGSAQLTFGPPKTTATSSAPHRAYAQHKAILRAVHGQRQSEVPAPLNAITLSGPNAPCRARQRASISDTPPERSTLDQPRHLRRLLQAAQDQAKTNRLPAGSGIGSPNSLAVSTHN
jgi:hypothetical protein